MEDISTWTEAERAVRRALVNYSNRPMPENPGKPEGLSLTRTITDELRKAKLLPPLPVKK